MHPFGASVTSCSFFSLFHVDCTSLPPTIMLSCSSVHYWHRTDGEKLELGKCKRNVRLWNISFVCLLDSCGLHFVGGEKRVFFAIREKAGASAQLQAPNFIGRRQRLGVIRTARPPCFFHEFSLSKFFPWERYVFVSYAFNSEVKKEERLLGAWQKHKGPRG